MKIEGLDEDIRYISSKVYEFNRPVYFFELLAIMEKHGWKCAGADNDRGRYTIYEYGTKEPGKVSLRWTIEEVREKVKL